MAHLTTPSRRDRRDAADERVARDDAGWRVEHSETIPKGGKTMAGLTDMTEEQRDAAREKGALARDLAKNVDGLLQEANLGLPPTHTASIRNRLKETPETARRGYLNAHKGKSRGAAIKAMCLECVGWQRREVALCTSQACPLFRYRPYRDIK